MSEIAARCECRTPMRESTPLGVAMQDKRRRNDFASTEVGEVKGGRVTQQAFEVADKKDSGIRYAAMPGTRGDGRKDAQENAAP